MTLIIKTNLKIFISNLLRFICIMIILKLSLIPAINFS